MESNTTKPPFVVAFGHFIHINGPEKRGNDDREGGGDGECGREEEGRKGRERSEIRFSLGETTSIHTSP